MYRTVASRRFLVGRLDCGVLLLDNLRQNSQSRQVVLHLLKSGQDGLAVVGHGLIVSCLILLHRGLAQPGIEKRFSETRPDGPDAARPGEPLQEARVLQAARSRQRKFG